ncbi:nuclear envelope integral membrane protein-like [Macrosteles quadrilineatus]|uniref:nuclear envelope integral membrane protein-like n=1 Tax=Macrosteles quadrilineatus TaxID=74068 RepID=UPI0023E1D28A|nr:nuclear envelope integral membrane protein-like [Macrosteles quadrilineatus]
MKKVGVLLTFLGLAVQFVCASPELAKKPFEDDIPNRVVDGKSDILLDPDMKYTCCSKEVDRSTPVIYCYRAHERALYKIWMSAKVWISLDVDKFRLYWGKDKLEVMNEFQYMNSMLNINMNLLSWNPPKIIHLNPFNSTCFGIYSKHDYELKLNEQVVNQQRQLMFSVGLFLFLFAGILSKQDAVYYSISTAAGVFLFSAFLLYFFINLMPMKRATSVGVFLGGGTIFLYIVNMLWNAISLFVLRHSFVVQVYVIVSASSSFLFVYNYLPPDNPRRVNTLKWITQVVAAVLMYNSSHNIGYMFILIVVLTVCYYVPIIQTSFNVARTVTFFWTRVLVISIEFFKRGVKMLYRRNQPPKPLRHLTVEEYRLQAIHETKKGLDNFRNYLKTEDGIRALTRLENSSTPRVIRFITRLDEHVTDEERQTHDMMYPELTDDED